jgi:hypothetical protein
MGWIGCMHGMSYACSLVAGECALSNEADKEVQTTENSDSGGRAIPFQSRVVSDTGVAKSAADEATERFFESKRKGELTSFE